MIFDCFPFFNELDLLEIRLNILNEVVDKFVLIESDRTHKNEPKPLFFEENKKRFSKFSHKIIHIKVEESMDLSLLVPDEYGETWGIENYQRDAIMRGLVDAQPDDIVHISDLDEIPCAEVLQRYRAENASGIWKLQMALSYYFLNNRCLTQPYSLSAALGRFSDLRVPPPPHCPSNATKRFWKHSSRGLPTYFRFCAGLAVRNAGWHFSYCGGVQSIREKINAIADGKPGNTNTTAKILDKIIRDGRDVYGRPDMRFISVQPDVFLPRYILEHRGKYAHLLNPGNAINAEEFARLRRRFKRRKRICRILSNLAITKKRTRSFYEFLLEKLI